MIFHEWDYTNKISQMRLQKWDFTNEISQMRFHKLDFTNDFSACRTYMQSLDPFCNGDGNEHPEDTLCSCFGLSPFLQNFHKSWTLWVFFWILRDKLPKESLKIMELQKRVGGWGASFQLPSDFFLQILDTIHNPRSTKMFSEPGSLDPTIYSFLSDISLMNIIHICNFRALCLVATRIVNHSLIWCIW